MNERHTIGRLVFVIQKLYEKGYFTVSELNDYIYDNTRTTLSKSTVKRTVSDLKNLLGMDIYFSRREQVYKLRTNEMSEELKEGFFDRFERIKRIPSKSRDLMIFYSFVKSMIYSEYYFPPRDVRDETGKVKDYDDILRMIENVLKDNLSERDIQLAEKIEYHLTEHYRKNQRTKFNNMINELLDSMRYEYLVRFSYHGSELIAEPVKLIHYNGVWYLSAYVVKSSKKESMNKVRTYNLALIESNIFKTKEKFTGDDYYVPEFKNSFGIISSSNTREAVIRFYGDLVDRMKEMLWNDHQITSAGEDIKKGRYCEYRLPYPANTSFELIGKVMSFRENAEIISPGELREEWKSAILKMYEMTKND